jgi:hypothetical protein
MKQTPETTFQEWRTQFSKQREDLLAKRAEIDEQIAEIDKELHAIHAYEQAKAGRGFRPQTERKPRAPSTRAPRGSREELKTKIIDVLKNHQEGLVSDQINQALGATEQKEKQQIANVLSLMKKDGMLHQEARRGPYSLPE